MHGLRSLDAQCSCRFPSFPLHPLGCVAAAEDKVPMQKESRCLRKSGCKPALGFGVLQTCGATQWIWAIVFSLLKTTKKPITNKNPPNHKLWNLSIVDCIDYMYTATSCCGLQLNVGSLNVSNVKKGRKKSHPLSRKSWRLKFFPKECPAARLATLQLSSVLPWGESPGYQWGLPAYLLVSRLELMKEQIWQAKLGRWVGEVHG